MRPYATLYVSSCYDFDSFHTEPERGEGHALGGGWAGERGYANTRGGEKINTESGNNEQAYAAQDVQEHDTVGAVCLDGSLRPHTLVA
jgi:hypothetical protein